MVCLSTDGTHPERQGSENFRWRFNLDVPLLGLSFLKWELKIKCAFLAGRVERTKRVGATSYAIVD